MSFKQKRLRESDFDLLFELFDNPRNLLEVSRRIGMPPTTVQFIVKKLLSSGTISLTPHINYEHIAYDGVSLEGSNIFCSIHPKKTMEFEETIVKFPFWDFKARYASNGDGYYVKLVHPEKKLCSFEEDMGRAGFFTGFNGFQTQETYPYHPDKKTRFWYDTKTRTYKPRWESWIEEIHKASTTRYRPEIPRKSLNGTGLQTLDMIRKNPTITSTDVGKEIGISAQAIRHQYNDNLKPFLAYEVNFLPDEKKMYFVSVLECTDGSSMNQIINSRSQNPFLRSVEKLKTPENTLLLYFTFPPPGYDKAWYTQMQLIREGLVKNVLHSVYLSSPESNPHLLQNLQHSIISS